MKLPQYSRFALVLFCASLLAALPASVYCAASEPRLPAYAHVVIVVMENAQERRIIGNSSAPYINWLASQGALLTGSYGCEHPSQPNYLDLFSGSNQGCHNDSVSRRTPFSTDNLGAELLHAGLSFCGYSEDLPQAGSLAITGPGSGPGHSRGDYARKHNPWSNWQNDADPAGPGSPGSNYLPASVNQPFNVYQKIVATGDYSRLPSVCFVIPNLQHDGHGVPGGARGNRLIADGDAWLKENIGPFAEWARDHDSLLILTYDEDDGGARNRIPTVFYGTSVRQGSFEEAHLNSVTSLRIQGSPAYKPVAGVNHWNVLRTIEDIFGLSHAGAAAKVEPVADVFEEQ